MPQQKIEYKIKIPKIKVNETYEKDEKTNPNFELSNGEDNVNETYLNAKIADVNGHISYIEKVSNEFKWRSKKHSEEEILIGKAVKTTVQLLHDPGLVDKYDKADKLLKEHFLKEVNERRRPNLDE